MIPTFVELRNSTLVDALTYYEFVVPCCKKATTEAASFFKNFEKDYKTIEEFVTDIEDVQEDTEKFAAAFSLCSNMHKPVLAQASFRSMQCRTLIKEAQLKNHELKKLVS